MGKKDDSLIIKSSKESKYGQCFCCCLLILMAFICKEEGLFAVCLIAALILLRVAMLSNEILILQANGLTVKRGKKERIYKWDEFCTKLVVNAKGERGRSKYINFSKYKYIQGRGLPAVFYQLISSYSCGKFIYNKKNKFKIYYLLIWQQKERIHCRKGGSQP